MMVLVGQLFEPDQMQIFVGQKLLNFGPKIAYFGPKKAVIAQFWNMGNVINKKRKRLIMGLLGQLLSWIR